MLTCIINTCLESDPESILLKHLLTIDGPSVACRHYWDWIEPHITAKIAYKHTLEGKKLSYSTLLGVILKLK